MKTSIAKLVSFLRRLRQLWKESCKLK